MTIEQQLRDAILASGKTRYELAKATGIDFKAFNEFVAGKRDLRLSSVEKIAEHFGMELTPPRFKRGKAATQAAKKK